jgi:hypothetical protein
LVWRERSEGGGRPGRANRAVASCFSLPNSIPTYLCLLPAQGCCCCSLVRVAPRMSGGGRRRRRLPSCSSSAVIGHFQKRLISVSFSFSTLRKNSKTGESRESLRALPLARSLARARVPLLFRPAARSARTSPARVATKRQEREREREMASGEMASSDRTFRSKETKRR